MTTFNYSSTIQVIVQLMRINIEIADHQVAKTSQQNPQHRIIQSVFRLVTIKFRCNRSTHAFRREKIVDEFYYIDYLEKNLMCCSN